MIVLMEVGDDLLDGDVGTGIWRGGAVGYDHDLARPVIAGR